MAADGGPEGAAVAVNRRAVMVIYGHDEQANDALFDWLRAIGLQPREWRQLVSDSGSASPYIGQVLDRAFEQAQAVVAFFTPDEHVIAAGPGGVKKWRLQARPNVLFEAGMALVTHPERTILVVLGDQELPSDLAGRYFVRLTPGDSRPLHDLATRLTKAGCTTDLTGGDWLKPSRFPDRDNVPHAYRDDSPLADTAGEARPEGGAAEDGAVREPRRAVAPATPVLRRPYRLRVTLTGHTGPVGGVAFSPDGSLLTTASGDKSVRLWNVSKGTFVRTLASPDSAMNRVAFSPDGSLVAAVGEDGAVWLLAVRGGGKSRRFAGDTTRIRTAVAFSPDGTLLATGGPNLPAQIWDVATGGEVRGYGHELGGVLSVAFSPDSTQLAVGTLDGNVVLWDLSTGQARHTLTGHSGPVTGVAFSPDGGQLGTASLDDTVRLWGVHTGFELRTLPGHSGGAYAVAFSREGEALASVGADKALRLWSAATGDQVRALSGHTDRVNNVAFSSSDMIATGSADTTLRIWF